MIPEDINNDRPDVGSDLNENMGDVSGEASQEVQRNSGGNPVAMAREAYEKQMPVNWDLAYTYFTSEDAPAIMDENDRTCIVNILNHGKFNRKLLRLSMMAFIVSVVGLILMDRIKSFYVHPLFKVVFLVWEIFQIAYAVITYRKDRFSSLRWLMPGICAAWLGYLFFWLI